MHFRVTLLAGLSLAVSSSVPLPVVTGQLYDVTPLPFFNTRGAALSNNGVVAGGIAHTDGSVSLGEWLNGVLTNLGAPPNLPSDFNRVRPFGINDCGVIVGTVHRSAGGVPSRTFIYNRGRFTVLPLVDPLDLGGVAIGINNRGEVVGYDITFNNEEKGWLWSNGAYFSLPVDGNNTAALGINSSGTVIGNRSLNLAYEQTQDEFCCMGERGYIATRGRSQYLSGFVYAINDRGEAAGGASSAGHSVATVFQDGIATVILTLPSFAVGINSFGEVVGSYEPAGYNGRRVFIWSANSGAFDVTPGGFRYAEGAAVNARGEVLAFGETADGTFHYFLLIPRSAGALTPKRVSSVRPTSILLR